MYNTDIPSRAELPSSKQLIRSTVIAAVSAVVLLFTVVLPSEYGVDPTGIGRALGLTEMGEIKTRLAQEAEADAAATLASHTETATSAAAPATSVPSDAVATPAAASALAAIQPATAGTVWRHEMTFTLTPGQGTEIKLKMKEGEKALFSWSVQGGVVNYDTHGDAIGRSISYEKGRGVPADEGELVAAFTGNHGWFWRNRGEADVIVVLKTGGEYSEIQRVK
jgi:hypothetical protein